MDSLDETPERVTVTGTDVTPDAEITMLEGATGARIPTGNHRTSAAMPDATSDTGGNGVGVLALLFVLGALVVVAIIAYLALA